MSLKQIPIENGEGTHLRGKKQFNPGGRIKKGSTYNSGISLKEVCMHLVNFINRGNQYTVEHVEKIITQLQRSVLVLQKKKTDIAKVKHSKGKKQPKKRN